MFKKNIKWLSGIFILLVTLQTQMITADLAPINKSRLIITHWGTAVDSSIYNNQTLWEEYLEHSQLLIEIGFTHPAYTIYDRNITSQEIQTIQSRINDLRQINQNLSIHISSGHIFLEEPDENDPQNHSKPPYNPNLKYFNASFNPFSCADCDASANPPIASRRALDPAYKGTIWQKELNAVENYLQVSTTTANDLVIFDTEIWGKNPSWVENYGYYPNVIQNSEGRYSGTKEERYAQYMIYWQQRGLDLKNKVEENNPNTRTIFYGEDIVSKSQLTWMPIGTGYASSPSRYVSPNLTHFKIDLDYYAGYNNSYPWISFSTVQTDLVSGNLSNINGPTSKSECENYCELNWDPRVSQKIGYMLREKNVSGIIIYPGLNSEDYTYEYFIAHSQALVKGFLDGEDIELQEVCADGWDNDGDGDFDESSCLQCDGFAKTEICDGRDNDCDQLIDEGLACCGNGACSSEESCSSCPTDCGICNSGGEGGGGDDNNDDDDKKYRNDYADEENDLSALGSQTGCVESWSCEKWSECENGIAFRECIDLNSCGTQLSIPQTTKECLVLNNILKKVTRYDLIFLGSMIGVIVLGISVFFLIRYYQKPFDPTEY